MNDQLKSILEQQLRDAHTPEAISWWPLAIGWWVLIAILLIAITVTAVKFRQHHKRNRYRKTAIKQLDEHFTAWHKHALDSAYLQAANTILKRACSHISDNATQLSGAPWVIHLNAHSKIELSVETQEALAHQLYQQTPDVDISRVHSEINTWLTKHSVKPLEHVSPEMEVTHA